MDKNEINRRYFGHDQFRPGQETLIDAILSGRDCLGIMPTGGGKSICYQIPALLLPGLTLVISPLVSLMADQVSALTSAGVPAACLHSGMNTEEYRNILWYIRTGKCKLLYISPERLDYESFFNMVTVAEVSLVAVDEAHCISQWGQDFRPSYRRIAEFLTRLPYRPAVAAFTATATEEVREDIIRLLGLQSPVVLVTGFDRPNLYFDVQEPKDKQAALLQLVLARRGRSGIVYCSTRADTEMICDTLCRSGIKAACYHAGLTKEQRQHSQEDFQFDRVGVMVATNAFGMGIDKSNVSFVIHYNMPKSLEAYYQEAGRAGRDGERAECILLYSPSDVKKAKYLIDHNDRDDTLSEQEREAVRQREVRRLGQMEGYCRTRYCFRAYLLDYFGQQHQERCNYCGNCQAKMVLQDVTVPAQMILSCVKRVRDKLGYSVGQHLIIQTLRGSQSGRVKQLGLNTLSTYGLMKTQSVVQIRAVLDGLIEKGCLRIDPKYGTVRLTEKAAPILYRGEKISMPVKMPTVPRLNSKSTPVTMSSPNMAERAPPEEEKLFEFLKLVRLEVAREEGIPVYVIFSDASLRDMAQRCPKNVREFLQVAGVVELKAKRYAKPFLNAIAVHLQRSQGSVWRK